MVFSGDQAAVPINTPASKSNILFILKSFKFIILQRFIKHLFFHLRKQVNPALVKDQVADVLPFLAVGRNTVLFTQLPESDQQSGLFVFSITNTSRLNVLLSDKIGGK